MENYIETAKEIYKDAALNPQPGLCCTTSPVWQFPELEIPQKMLEMNYGCGSTVHPGDLVDDPRILYVGVGGGMEMLQFAYFNRNKSGVIGIDAVDEMITICDENLVEAEKTNPWFKRDFVELVKGDALNLNIENESVDIAAQNCLFNIFEGKDLRKAVEEMYRVLKPRGKLILSDPVSESEMPENLVNDEKLRALCLSGSIPLNDYIKILTDAGFGTIEIRAKRPYRILSPNKYDTDKLILIDSVEVAAIKDPMPKDGPCVFTGKSAIYFGDDEYFDDGNGHTLMPNKPLTVCDKTADALKSLERDDIYISESTFFYNGGGCC